MIGKRKAKAYRSAIIEKVLPELELDGMVLEGVEDEQADIFFSYGTLCVHQEKQQQHTENVFLQPFGQLSLEIETFDSKTEFRQSNKSQQFVQANEEEEDQQQGYVKMGSILHHVFSTIRTVADIDVALRQLEQEGILYDDEITAAKVSSMLRKRLESPRVKEWFSDKWTLYNECSILYTDADGHVCERRPDRVMSDGQRLVVVDFKFGHPRPEYQEQVREYMTLLQQMGHHQVEGYIWYVYSNQIESVK